VGTKKRPELVRATRFRAASEERWRDASCLHRAGRFDGAIYMCGYVLECFLKFVLCERRGQACIELEEAKRLSHNLPALLDAAGLRPALTSEPDLWVAFQRISGRWDPQMRYAGKTEGEKSSEAVLRDTKDLRNWLQTQLRP